MSKIVISGYYGFNNAGDEALLTAILASLREREPESEITVISGSPADTKRKHPVASVHRFSASGILGALGEADLLISGGGSLLQDVTSKKSLLYYLAVIAAARLKGCKVMLFAQGIGPIRNGIMRRLTSLVCRGVDYITVRDRDSADELLRLGIPGEKVEVTADCVLTLPPVTREKGGAILREYGLDPEKPVVGVSVRNWPDNGNCLRELAEALATISRKHGAQVALLPLQFPADVEVCRQLKEQLPAMDEQVVLLDRRFTTEEFLSLIGNFSLLIGMRLHALIFAAVAHVPLLAVSYDPKVDSFVESIAGRAVGTVENLRAEDVVEAADRALSCPPAEQDEHIASLRKLAERNAEQAFRLLHM